jgi:hypothetical protein
MAILRRSGRVGDKLACSLPIVAGSLVATTPNISLQYMKDPTNNFLLVFVNWQLTTQTKALLHISTNQYDSDGLAATKFPEKIL